MSVMVAVRERPMIFSAPMVRAICRKDSPKTQTRRVAKDIPAWAVKATPWTGGAQIWDKTGRGMNFRECPYGMPGHRLWVRETWSDANSDAGPVICYRADLGRRYLSDDAWPIEYERYPGGRWANWAADLERGVEGRWRSPIHMYRWACRLVLEITDVRLQRLQDITEADAIAEGVRRFDDIPLDPWHSSARADRWSMVEPKTTGECLGTARYAFGNFWEKLHGFGAWDRNDWVWAITFKRLGNS